MEEKKSLSGSTVWYSAGNFLVRAVSFVLLPLYSHFISTGDFGVYSLLMSFYAIAAVLFQSGMQNALIKYYLEDEDKEKRKRIFSSIINSIGIMGIIFTIAGCIFSRGITQLVVGDAKYSNLTVLVFISLLVDTLGYFGLQLLKTRERAKKVVIYSIISAAVNLILNIVLIYVFRFGVEGIFIAQIVSSVFLFILLLKDIHSEYRPVIEREFIKKAFLFSMPIILGGFLSAAVDVCDRFFLNSYTDKNIVGIYSLSYKIGLVMNVFVISFRTAWAPHALNLYKKPESAEAFGKTFLKLIASGFLIMLAVILFAPFIFEIKIFNGYLFDKTYEPGLVILPYVLAGYFLNGIIGYYSIYPFISNKSYHFLISDGSAFVINIILNIALIPVIGMLGAAIATTTAFAVSAAYLYVISINRIKVIYPARDIIITLIVSITIILAGIYGKNILANIFLIIMYLLIITRLSGINIKGFKQII